MNKIDFLTLSIHSHSSTDRYQKYDIELKAWKDGDIAIDVSSQDNSTVSKDVFDFFLKERQKLLLGIYGDIINEDTIK